MAAKAKDIVIKNIDAPTARRFIERYHYSGKTVNNSQLHYGVFLDGKLEGAMQYGPPMRRDFMMRILPGTPWHDLLELNRMAFSDRLPRNSESRAIAYTLRHIKKHKPAMRMIISFADGTKCGDGTIYRASGFMLTQIKRNVGLRQNPKTGEVMQQMQAYHLGIDKEFRKWPALDGFQFRYLYLYDQADKQKLTCPVLPFSKIKELGVGMYKGEHR